ncbi:Dihydropyrimidine Dehydrogenase [Nadp(+)] [Manis pentadactyla]|nr:Dihydropyrimidine Dehydrogenase [Nadp(+)] [Manis pentadactyla]
MSSKSSREHTNVVIVASQVQLLGSLNVKGHKPRLTGKRTSEATSGWTQDLREGHTVDQYSHSRKPFLPFVTKGTEDPTGPAGMDWNYQRDSNGLVKLQLSLVMLSCNLFNVISYYEQPTAPLGSKK